MDRRTTQAHHPAWRIYQACRNTHVQQQEVWTEIWRAWHDCRRHICIQLKCKPAVILLPYFHINMKFSFTLGRWLSVLLYCGGFSSCCETVRGWQYLVLSMPRRWISTSLQTLQYVFFRESMYLYDDFFRKPFTCWMYIQDIHSNLFWMVVCTLHFACSAYAMPRVWRRTGRSWNWLHICWVCSQSTVRQQRDAFGSISRSWSFLNASVTLYLSY